MKKLSLLVVCLSVLFASFAQDGKYAGPVLKKLVGKKFKNEKKINGLAGYTFKEGTLITPISDPAGMVVDVYQKGTTGVLLFCEVTDTLNMEFTILDVLEIKNIQKGWEIKVATCNEGQTEENVDIVALAKTGRKERTSTISKAWRCNRDKRRIEIISTKNISCLNEGMEQF